MDVAHLELATDSYSEFEMFYSETLELPVDSQSQSSFTTTVGSTEWRFSAAESNDN